MASTTKVLGAPFEQLWQLQSILTLLSSKNSYRWPAASGGPTFVALRILGTRAIAQNLGIFFLLSQILIPPLLLPRFNLNPPLGLPVACLLLELQAQL